MFQKHLCFSESHLAKPLDILKWGEYFGAHGEMVLAF